MMMMFWEECVGRVGWGTWHYFKLTITRALAEILVYLEGTLPSRTLAKGGGHVTKQNFSLAEG
jgi:hypothetical protein